MATFAGDMTILAGSSYRATMCPKSS